MIHKIKITQVYRVVRTIEVEAEGFDAYGVAEEFASGERDIPTYNDPRWSEQRTLENEEVYPA